MNNTMKQEQERVYGMTSFHSGALNANLGFNGPAPQDALVVDASKDLDNRGTQKGMRMEGSEVDLGIDLLFGGGMGFTMAGMAVDAADESAYQQNLRANPAAMNGGITAKANSFVAANDTSFNAIPKGKNSFFDMSPAYYAKPGFGDTLNPSTHAPQMPKPVKYGMAA